MHSRCGVLRVARTAVPALLIFAWALFALLRAAVFATAAGLAWLTVLHLAEEDDGAWFELAPEPHGRGGRGGAGRVELV